MSTMKELLWVSLLLAIAGKGFCVVASDTRMSLGYSIVSRTVTKLFKLTDTAILATSGMVADMEVLQTKLRDNIELYYF